MPDWFYRTVSQPILFRLPAPLARDFALGFMGRLARLPFGPFLIDFLGHMRADPRLRQTLLDTDFPSAVGFGPWLDTRAVALPALARFGVGFIEVGPVTLERHPGGAPIERLEESQALWFDDSSEAISLAECNQRVSKSDVPVIVRLAPTPGVTDELDQELQRLLRELTPEIRLVSLSTIAPALASQWSSERWGEHLRAVLMEAPQRAVLLCVPVDQDFDRLAPLIDAALELGVKGLIIDGRIAWKPRGCIAGMPVLGPAMRQVQWLRERYGPDVPIIAAGGVHEPESAMQLRAAGADLVQVDTGLIYTGPGLIKRINDCFLFQSVNETTAVEPNRRAAEFTWFWTTLMGIGMFFGGLLALGIAATKVVLPYDEAFLGISRADIPLINPRLLDFMAHDRVTLAGVMVAIGLLYVVMSVFGIRRGLHWTRQAVFVSAFTGFASFFLFLGFGYLDTFHAFVTAALLQLLLLGVHAKLGTYVPKRQPDARGDWTWRLGLWGQLLMICHGFALLAAGLVISIIGVTHVFVPEDLEFMGTTAAVLHSSSPRLVPLVAHDRATLGGMLFASGWLFLLPALWGYRRGSAWLWWALLLAGSVAYSAAIAMHYAVGYLSVKHLLPAFGGFALMLLGLGLSYPFLCGIARSGLASNSERERAVGAPIGL